ncbi:MAG TPA: VCBS repeat-containing protein [Chthoniobacteraceae bacterium]|nr:VCBS repeat-containing protein [Chthoniobacteraceae bacterium]
MNHDGFPDLIAGKAGGGNRVNVFDIATGTTMPSFHPFTRGFTGGVFVAAGDVNDDGFADIVVGKAAGGPKFSVFSGIDGSNLFSIKVFPERYRGGVTVAVGDVDGDDVADIRGACLRPKASGHCVE